MGKLSPERRRGEKAFSAPNFRTVIPKVKGEITDMRVMTYNIQHGQVHLSDHIDLTKVCGVIRSLSPDVVGLNEVRGRGEAHDYTAQAEEMAAQLGYHCFFGRSIYVGGQNPYGNAILSKYPIERAEVIHIPDPSPEETAGVKWVEHRSICRAVVDFPNPVGRVAVYSSHFGLSQPEQRNAVRTVVDAVSDEKLPFFVMGDFNVTPDDPILSPLNERLVSTGELLDGKLSFPSDRPDCRIDYIFGGGVRFDAADIPVVVASDHCPVWADACVL